MDPIHPKFTQNVPNSIPILINYITALEAHRKAVDGTEIA
jgi:hypothetical protein